MADFTTTGVALHAWPTLIKPSEITLHLRYNTSAFTSPFTRTTQTTELPGALFEVSASVPSMSPEAVRAARAFVATLRGMAGRFVFPAYACRYAPPAMGQPERVTVIGLTADTDTITADTTLFTADETTVVYETQFTVSTTPSANTITGTLWLNSSRAPLQVGGFISWDDATGWRHLHIVTAMATNTDTLVTALTVEPPMRALPTTETPMHVHAPSGVMMLTADGEGALRQAGNTWGMTLSAVQAFPLQVTA